MALHALRSKKTAVASTLLLAFALGAGGYFAYVQAAAPADAPPSPTPAAIDVAAAPAPRKPRSKEEAAAALMALPELQTWSALLEKNSGGTTHGALIEYDPAPRKLHGKSYWQFSFVENSAEAALRWESFLASSSDDEILVEDATTDELLSLERWRKDKHPALRRGIDG